VAHAATGQPSNSDQAAREIIFKALERATENEEHNFAAQYRSQMFKHIKRFDGQGNISEEDQGDYEVEPIDGVPFERRLTVGDRPLSDEEQRWEQERLTTFRKELQRLRTEAADDEEAIRFNQELAERYVFVLEQEELYRNRPTYRVSFHPRSDDLPVRRRIDYALNKARGTVWIDRETYEAARVEFELIDKVRLWWGMLGTINHARGSVDRRPVLDDTWVQVQFETYSDTRAVFKRTRRSEFRQWQNFEWIKNTDNR
tara:strand:- start:875 stop:1648 length:774 start_codon:yes stop_codon:yes gene_type:complete